MKSMKYFSYALCAAALAFASCTQPTNGNVGGDKDLVLSASKSEITADGTDKVTFTVKYGEEDVTARRFPEASLRRRPPAATSSSPLTTARSPIR